MIVQLCIPQKLRHFFTYYLKQNLIWIANISIWNLQKNKAR